MSGKKMRHDAQRALDIEQARQRKAEIRERSKATVLRMLEAGLSTERRPLQDVTTGMEAGVRASSEKDGGGR